MLFMATTATCLRRRILLTSKSPKHLTGNKCVQRWNTAHLSTHSYLRAFLSVAQMCLRLFVWVFLQSGMCNETEPDGGDCRSKGRSGICVKENDAPFRICNTSRAWALDSLSRSHGLNCNGRRKWIRRHHELCRSIFGLASNAVRLGEPTAEYYLSGYSLVPDASL